MESQADNAATSEAIEVNDVDSAAQEIERRMTLAEQPEQSQDTETQEADEVQTETEETEQTVSDEVETDEVETETEETEQNESDDQEPGEEESETLHYENVDQLAEALDMSKDDFLENIKITRKIDGVEEEVTLAELRNGNQRDADYRRKTTELAENRKAFEGEIEKVKADLAQKYQEAESITATLEQQLLEDFQSVDWNALELQDKEEWNFQRQKFGEKQNQIQALKQQTQERLAEQQKELQQKQVEADNQLRAEHSQKLLTVIPEWQDQEVWKADDAQMRQFLSEYEVTEQDIGQIYDYRLIKLIRDAMKNQTKTDKVEVVKKKVKKLPKIVKPGAAPDKVAAQKKAKADKLKQLKQSGGQKIDDIANALMDRI